ncbi:hypothetical protein J3F83DRAFT_261102 [Trichoderma novae-zelandiae]
MEADFIHSPFRFQIALNARQTRVAATERHGLRTTRARQPNAATCCSDRIDAERAFSLGPRSSRAPIGHCLLRASKASISDGVLDTGDILVPTSTREIPIPSIQYLHLTSSPVEHLVARTNRTQSTRDKRTPYLPCMYRQNDGCSVLERGRTSSSTPRRPNKLEQTGLRFQEQQPSPVSRTGGASRREPHPDPTAITSEGNALLVIRSPFITNPGEPLRPGN